MQVLLNWPGIANRQVVVTDRAEQEGLSGVNLTGVIWLKADGRLAIDPDSRIAAVLPLIVMGLHPVLTGLRVTRTGITSLIIPFPRHTARNVGPRIVCFRVGATKRRPERSVTRAYTILGHTLDDAVTNKVVVVGGGVGLRVVRDTLAHPGRNLADINLGGGGFLGRLGSLGGLGGSDLGDDQHAGGSCHDGQGGQGAGCDSCSLGPRMACAHSTRCH